MSGDSFDVIVVGGGHAGCEAVADGPSLGSPTGMDSQRLAWVIANGSYGGDWPSLAIVAEDRKAMVALLDVLGIDDVCIQIPRSRARR